MKTAISIPDDLFDQADCYAKEHNLSRSELYAKAMRAYLEVAQGEAVTEALNRVYESESGEFDPFLSQLARLTLERNSVWR